MSNTSIRVDGLGKQYHIGRKLKKFRTLRELTPRSARTYSCLRLLRARNSESRRVQMSSHGDISTSMMYAPATARSTKPRAIANTSMIMAL